MFYQLKHLLSTESIIWADLYIITTTNKDFYFYFFFFDLFLQMDAKLPMETFEEVMALAVEGCKTVETYIREILLEHTKQLEFRRGN